MQYLYTLAIFCIFYSIDLKSFSMAVLSMMITMRKRDSFLYLNVGRTHGQTDGRTLLLMYVWTGLLNILVQNKGLGAWMD